MTLSDWTDWAADPRMYRGLQAIHLIGLASLFGGLLLLELRMLGWRRRLDVDELARLAVPVALAGFALCLASGAAMFVTQPTEFWINGAFRLKMLLILLAGLNAAVLHRQGGPGRDHRVIRVQALASLLIWVAVIVCGRWIAVV